jgi:1-acyl-sn-glycerol-3-phosphate acyltransferase
MYVCRIVSIIFFETRVFGVEWVPRRGSTLIASTHKSVMDPWIVGMIPNRSSCYLAKESLFRVPFLGWLIRRYDAFPISRDTVAARSALDLCVKILQEGRALVFFPEGTRSEDGGLQPLKRGVALVAKRSGALVLPVSVVGTYACWPRGAVLPRPGRVRVSFGTPLAFVTNESSDSFVERLSGRLRQLAVEADLREAARDESLSGEGDNRGKETLPAPGSSAEASNFRQIAGDDSLVTCPTPLFDGRFCPAEA